LEIFKSTLNREYSSFEDRVRFLKNQYEQIKTNTKDNPSELYRNIEDIDEKFGKIIKEMEVTAIVMKELDMNFCEPYI